MQRKKVLRSSGGLSLEEVRRPGRGGKLKTCFHIKLSWWQKDFKLQDYESARDIADPFRNKSGASGPCWRYRSRKSAEQIYMMLLLKFAGRL